MSLSHSNQTRKQSYFFTLKSSLDEVFDLVVGIADNFFTGIIAISSRRSAGSYRENIRNFGNGTDGGSGAFGSGFLLNGNYRRKSINLIHIGSFQTTKKLPCISRKGFDVSSLSLRIYGIKSERRFSTAAQTCDNYQFFSWDFYVDVLEIMFSGSVNFYEIIHSFAQNQAANLRLLKPKKKCSEEHLVLLFLNRDINFC